jgi:hypothetical protein
MRTRTSAHRLARPGLFSATTMPPKGRMVLHRASKLAPGRDGARFAHVLSRYEQSSRRRGGPPRPFSAEELREHAERIA